MFLNISWNDHIINITSLILMQGNTGIDCFEVSSSEPFLSQGEALFVICLYRCHNQSSFLVS